jgi:hypothetical protein
VRRAIASCPTSEALASMIRACTGPEVNVTAVARMARGETMVFEHGEIERTLLGAWILYATTAPPSSSSQHQAEVGHALAGERAALIGETSCEVPLPPIWASWLVEGATMIVRAGEGDSRHVIKSINRAPVFGFVSETRERWEVTDSQGGVLEVAVEVTKAGLHVEWVCLPNSCAVHDLVDVEPPPVDPRMAYRLGTNTDGSFDEIVVGNWLHVECMGTDDEEDGELNYWVRIGDARILVSAIPFGKPATGSEPSSSVLARPVVNVERGAYGDPLGSTDCPEVEALKAEVERCLASEVGPRGRSGETTGPSARFVERFTARVAASREAGRVELHVAIDECDVLAKLAGRGPRVSAPPEPLLAFRFIDRNVEPYRYVVILAASLEQAVGMLSLERGDGGNLSPSWLRRLAAVDDDPLELKPGVLCDRSLDGGDR